MSKTKRKTRSDKFPLTFHSTGQYCKKIKGKMHYFGEDTKIIKLSEPLRAYITRQFITINIHKFEPGGPFVQLSVSLSADKNLSCVCKIRFFKQLAPKKR